MISTISRQLGFVLALGVLPLLHAADATAKKPNLVILLADDLGYGDVHALNPERGKIATPHFDRLVREGMTFTDAHGGSSVCTPTRYGLLTGRYAWRTRLQHGVLDGYVEPLIAPDRLTLPAMLKQQGYHTACIGKWHLGFTIEGAADKSGGGKKKAGGGEKKAKGGDGNGSGLGRFPGAPMGARTRDGPLTRGFDTFFGFHHARMMESMFEGDQVTELVPPVETLPRLVRRGRDYIAERVRAGAPFMLYLALSSPHTPIVPSKEWQGKSGLGAYADFVMETDWALGEVLAALEQAGIARDTLVIATSDNGCSPAAGTDKLEAQGHFASAQFRGYKADIWDGGHRIPFVARWPGRVRAGARADNTICLTDLITTMAEITGARIPATAAEDSFSFLPDLLGTGHGARRSIVHHSIHGRFALREGPWKLEFCPGSGGWAKPIDADAKAQGLPDIQLYDLSKDIAEQHNLQAARPEIVQRLTAQLRDFVERGRSTPGPARKNDAAIDLFGEQPKERK
ncbi:MAG: arylsulfatase [Opitutaceae bacterium]|nr:arylsulfatase [Opitutaceae bacterium]